MIEPLGGLPAGVIGFRALGTIEASDYRDVLEPAFDAAIANGGKINCVVVLGSEFDHFASLVENYAFSEAYEQLMAAGEKNTLMKKT